MDRRKFFEVLPYFTKVKLSNWPPRFADKNTVVHTDVNAHTHSPELKRRKVGSNDVSSEKRPDGDTLQVHMKETSQTVTLFDKESFFLSVEPCLEYHTDADTCTITNVGSVIFKSNPSDLLEGSSKDIINCQKKEKLALEKDSSLCQIEAAIVVRKTERKSFIDNNRDSSSTIHSQEDHDEDGNKTEEHFLDTKNSNFEDSSPSYSASLYIRIEGKHTFLVHENSILSHTMNPRVEEQKQSIVAQNLFPDSPTQPASNVSELHNGPRVIPSNIVLQFKACLCRIFSIEEKGSSQQKSSSFYDELLRSHKIIEDYREENLNILWESLAKTNTGDKESDYEMRSEKDMMNNIKNSGDNTMNLLKRLRRKKIKSSNKSWESMISLIDDYCDDSCSDIDSKNSYDIDYAFDRTVNGLISCLNVDDYHKTILPEENGYENYHNQKLEEMNKTINVTLAGVFARNSSKKGRRSFSRIKKRITKPKPKSEKSSSGVEESSVIDPKAKLESLLQGYEHAITKRLSLISLPSR